MALAKDAAGRYLLSEGAPLFVYSAQGQFLRTVGRRGGGPGEYRRIWRIAPFSKGTIIFDDFAKRNTVLSLDFNVIDIRPSPEAPLSVIVREHRSGVMESFVNTPARKGIPLHDFDTQGALGRSYGASRTPYRADLRDHFERKVSKGTMSNTFWINHDPPPPQLMGVSQDDDRILWTLTWVAGPPWRSSVKLETRNESSITDFDGYFDTIVERIDLRTNTVVASQRFDRWYSGFAGPGEVWSYREDDDLIGRIDVFKLRTTQLQ